jgi:two-component system, cell cycle response regulator
MSGWAIPPGPPRGRSPAALAVNHLAVDTASEIDRLRRRVHELEELVRTDPVTGLYNRRHLEAELIALASAARRRGDCLGVLLIDVDRFKRINDRLSYQAGDHALQSVADRIRSIVRAEDVVGRWGGDEFVVLLPSSDLDAAVTLARRLRVAAAGSVNGDGPALPVTVSIGCAAGLAPDGPALIAVADAALHRAKSRGRNRVSS